MKIKYDILVQYEVCIMHLIGTCYLLQDDIHKLFAYFVGVNK